ncbi:lantibiotic dehydratase [Kitasatospora sp. NPDC051914]|uniref:lantibiotic dehydratase n=1 Tax=Kitasatospora sp. NPDC051914 TaxID=3154945 RepID=UPI0034227533
MSTRHSRPLYGHRGVAMIRATTHDPATTRLPQLQPADGDAAAWLREVWQNTELRTAITLASPDLARRLDQVQTGEETSSRQARRTVLSLTAYLLRWERRATPFGLFAGIATAELGRQTSVHWGQNHRPVVRANSGWLARIVADLERHTELLARLPVRANPDAFLRGDRLVVPGQAPDHEPEDFAPIEVTIRHTDPVQTAMAAAAKPVAFHDLVEHLCASYPERAQVAGLLAELVHRGALLTSLRPPMTSTDPLGHVLGELDNHGTPPTRATTERRLRSLHTAMLAVDNPAGLEPLLRSEPGALMTDVRLDCAVTVPAQVADEAAATASALLRLTPDPFGAPHWKAWHHRFLDRYGIGAAVPVRDLVQSGTGLGLPAGFLGSPYRRTPQTLTNRDETLLAWVQRAALRGDREIVLTEELIDALEVGDFTEAVPPPRAEIAVQVHAASREDLDRGHFRLTVTGTPRTGASMAGRFLDVLTDPGRTRLAEVYAQLPTSRPGALPAQLVFPPRRRAAENVARTPQILPHLIHLSGHHTADSGTLALDDLAVTADAGSLHLIQLSTGRPVEPVVLHALEARVQTPPLARFLAEIAGARSAVFGAFHWGATARLPYLPRLRHGRTILAPARWLLDAADLPTGASAAEWDENLAAWRKQTGCPADVLLTEGELRLPLDLDHDLHRAILRARLDKAQQIELREAAPPDSDGWLGRAHELLIPLVRLTPPAQRTPTVTLLRPADPDAAHLPGNSPWLSAQLHGHPDHQDEILTGHLPRLLATWRQPPQWWFRRYRDLTRPDIDQHLRLHIRLTRPTHYTAAATRLADWAAELRSLGLLTHLQLATYQPETGRYGHGAAMTAAEHAVAADSVVALAQIAAIARTDLPVESVTAASLVDLAVAFTGHTETGLRWLVDHLPHDPVRTDPTTRAAAIRLTDPQRGPARLAALPGGDGIAHAWDRRRTALATYRDRLADQRDPLTVLRSLLHLHHVRVLGVDPDRERITTHLARTAALRWATAPAGATR